MEMTIRFHASRALWPTINARPCTDCGPNNNEYCCDDEKEALKPSRCRTAFDESPYDVLAIHKVREKSSGNNELVNQRLMTIFEISGLTLGIGLIPWIEGTHFEPTILRGSSVQMEVYRAWLREVR
jgi:hypothetical protein